MITVQTILDKVKSDTNNISGRYDINDIYVYLNDFANFIRRNHLLPWTKKEVSLKVFKDVIEYNIPDDVSDFYDPQKPYPKKDDTYFIDVSQPELARDNGCQNKIALDYKSGSKIIALRSELGQDVLTIDPLSDITNWVLTGDGSGLVVDMTYYRVGQNSFKVTNTPNLGYFLLTNSNLSISMSNFIGKAFQFLYLNAPGAITGLEITFGNDINNTWKLTTTEQFNGTLPIAGWNLFGLDSYLPTILNGTPNAANPITYVQIKVLTTVAGPYYLNGFQFKNWIELILPYYSIYNFTDGNKVPKEYCDAPDDILLGDNEYDDCGRFFCSSKVAKYKIKKEKDLIVLLDSDYKEAYRALTINHPDLRRKNTVNWYPNTNRGGFPMGNLRRGDIKF